MVTKARAALAGVVFLVAFLTRPPTATEPAEQPLERGFAEMVQPFLKNYCLTCHSGEKPKGKLDLAGYTTAAAVLEPKGFVFAPHPVVTDTDRDKYCVQRIVAFYERHRVDYADYFLAAWRFQHREKLGKPKASLRDFAAEAGLGTPYLSTIWSHLTEAPPASGPLGEVQEAWRKLPAEVEKQSDARRDCERMRDLVIRLRKEFRPKVDK